MIRVSAQSCEQGGPPTEVQNPPKSAREGARRGAGLKQGARGSARCSSSLFLEETHWASTFPSTSPSTLFQAGTSPSTLLSTFGGLGVLHFCRGPPRSQSKSQSYMPKVRVTDQKSELRLPESEPNRPEKKPEYDLGASAENPPLKPS